MKKTRSKKSRDTVPLKYIIGAIVRNKYFLHTLLQRFAVHIKILSSQKRGGSRGVPVHSIFLGTLRANLLLYISKNQF
jgi:hypothetical protein